LLPQNPGRISRFYKECVCQTLENKTASSECYRCRREKNGRDRILVIPLSSYDIVAQSVNEYIKE
jgi:hypothetical protein